MASNDLALILRKGIQFAVGAGTATDAGGGAPTVGGRIRGGFSAISPAFRDVEELNIKREGLELDAERIRELQRRGDIAERGVDIGEQRLGIEQAEEDRRAQEQTRLDEEKSIDSVLPGIDNDQIQQLEALIGDVIDNNTRTFRVGDFEDRYRTLQKDNPDAVAQIMKTGVANADKSLKTIRGNISEEAGKIIESQGKLGKSLTMEDVINDPSLHSSNLSKLLQARKESQAKKETNNRFLSLFRQEKKAEELTRLQETRSVGFDRDLSGVQDELDGASTLEEKRELVLKLVDFYKGQRSEIIQQLRLSHPDVMNSLGFGTSRDTGVRTP